MVTPATRAVVSVRFPFSDLGDFGGRCMAVKVMNYSSSDMRSSNLQSLTRPLHTDRVPRRVSAVVGHHTNICIIRQVLI